MYSMSPLATADQPINNNDMNPSNPYMPSYIQPSLFSSLHHQHQPYENVVNPEMLIPQPQVLQWPPTRTAEMQQTGFIPLNVPENGVPWKCPEWMANQNIQPGTYMCFNAQQQQQQRFGLPCKRKATTDMEPIQTKQLITEEKMAAHLSGMHISSDFTAHDINQSSNTNDASNSLSSFSASLQDIEEKLKRAQKITVSDVVKTIQEEPILPAAIMKQFEKPCKALVIWQPPQRITDLITSKAASEQTANNDNVDDDDDENADNNNVEFVDLTISNDSQMDLDC